MRKAEKMKRVMIFSLALSLIFSVMSITPAPAYGAADVTITGKSVTDIQAAIQSNIFTRPVSGGTITVEGNKTNADSLLDLYIPAKVKVVWKATYAGTGPGDGKMIKISGDGTFEVQSGSISAPVGGQAIYADNSNVAVNGGTVSTAIGGQAIYATNSNVTVSGGIVSAVGMAHAIESSGSVTVTGGRVVALNNSGAAIFLFGNGIAAYLKDTCIGNMTVNTMAGTKGLIVEVDCLRVPAERSGSAGLVVKAGGKSALWDMTGTRPKIELTLQDNSKKSLTWGTKFVAQKGVKTQPKLYLVKGKTAKLPAAVQPYNATDKGITWKSKNSKIATVTAKGKVKGIKVGKTTIAVTTSVGGKTSQCKVYVVKKAKKLKKIALSPGKATSLTVGQTRQVVVTRSPAKATGIVPIYSSGRPSVAVIDKTGVITALKAGQTTITVKAGKKTKKFILTVL